MTQDDRAPNFAIYLFGILYKKKKEKLISLSI